MNRQITVLAASLLAVAVAVGVGVMAYNIGVAQGVAESGRLVSAPAGTPYVYVWPRPWGFGFPFVFPLLFFAFWFFAARALFWRGRFEEWHRRAHAQTGKQDEVTRS